LQTAISWESNFTEEQIKLLIGFIQEEPLTMDNVSDKKLLMQYAKQYIVKKSQIPINIEVDAVDLFDEIEKQEYHQYNIPDKFKLNIGDYVYLNIEELGFRYEPLRIMDVKHNPLKCTLSITLSNQDKIAQELFELTYIFKAASSAASVVEVKKDEFGQYTEDKSSILFQGNTIDSGITPITGGGISITQNGLLGNDIGTQGVIQLLNDRLVISKDGMQHFDTLLSGNGLYLENAAKTSRTVLSVDYGFQIDRKVSGVWDNIFYINSTDGSLHLDGGYIELLTENHLNKILIDPTVGFKIQNADGLGGWDDTFYIDTSGNLITNIAQVNSTLTLGSGNEYGSLQYKSGVVIRAYDDSIQKGLLYSANTHLFDYGSHVDFSLCADVNFTNVNVIGLTAKFG
jgi:hypothetical protein